MLVCRYFRNRHLFFIFLKNYESLKTAEFNILLEVNIMNVFIIYKNL